MSDIKDTKCSEHNRVFEFLCDQCNLLLCPRCNNNHLRENQNHTCNHIEDIRHSLEKLNLNNNSDSTTLNSNNCNLDSTDQSSNSYSRFDSEIEELWKTIKRSSEEIELLHLKENEISDRFRSLHEYLVVEEHKFKKPITEDINNILDTINNSIDHLKSIINIVNISNNDIKKYNEEYVGSEGEIDSSTSSPDTDKYSIDNIIKSIKEIESIQQFIHNNKNTVFSFDQSILDEYKYMYNNDIDTMVLDLIFQHNREHKEFNTETIVKITNYQYTLEINEIKDFISSILQKQQQQQQSIDMKTNNHKSELTYSTHSKGVTIFDITNNTVLKEISIEYNFRNSFTSIVNINNEYIYIFSSHNTKNQFCKYDIKNNIFYAKCDTKEPKLYELYLSI